jgi:hypothetical protein
VSTLDVCLLLLAEVSGEDWGVGAWSRLQPPGPPRGAARLSIIQCLGSVTGWWPSTSTWRMSLASASPRGRLRDVKGEIAFLRVFNQRTEPS